MTLFATARAPRQIVVGAGQRRAASAYASKLGGRALICTDGYMGQQPALTELVDQLSAVGIVVQVFDGVEPEVPLDCLARIVQLGRAFAPDMIIGLGGGSCLDAAKVTSLLLAHGGDVQDYYGEYRVPGPILPIIALPTTAGTGSEVTPVAVVADPERTLKVGVASPELIPHTAICDPELTLTCPASLTAVSGADALTHAIEAFTAKKREPTPDLSTSHVFLGKNVFSDHYALLAITRISRSLERAVSHGDDLAAREDMVWGSMLAGLAFGVAGTASAHALQYPIGALTHTAHGAGVACLMPYVMEFNRPSCPAAFAQIADALGVPLSVEGETDRSIAAIDTVDRIFRNIGIPRTTADLGLTSDQIQWTVDQSLEIARLIKNNPRELDHASMLRLLEAAQSGARTDLRAA
jgi:alcohol dehydrogenase